jgi:methyl-accepting chemotaxis protein
LVNVMSKSRTNELEDYVKRIGEHINAIYLKINEVNKKMKEIENEILVMKAESANNVDAIANLKENTVQKSDFDEFVSRLTESLRELLPPIPAAIEETKKE